MILGLIPSRLNSKRLKEKPLLEIDGLPIIIHSMKRAKLSKRLDDVIVCTTIVCAVRVPLTVKLSAEEAVKALFACVANEALLANPDEVAYDAVRAYEALVALFAKAEAAPMGPNKRFACRVVNCVFARSQNWGTRMAPIISIHT